MAASGIGLDLLDIDRLERAIARHPRLADRVFTAAERSYAGRRGRPARHLAARFCAKEAVTKALGLETIAFREVEVVSGDGAPAVRLSGAAAARARELGVRPVVSLTHERTVAGAAAILAPDEPAARMASHAGRERRG